MRSRPRSTRSRPPATTSIAGPEQGCCGALHLHNGELATGESMREQLLAGLPAGAILVSTAAGCGAALREHDERVLDLSEALVRAPVPPQGSGGGPVAVFDACHLLHAQGVREAPRELLRGAGYEPVELRRRRALLRRRRRLRLHAAGALPAARDVVASMRSARAARVSSAAATRAARCSCAAALREAQLDVRVAHPAELVVEAAAPQA